MRTYPQAILDALAARTIIERRFVWFTVRDRSDGSLVSEGYWNDVGDITTDVIDAATGATLQRVYQGSGGLMEVDPIPRAMRLQVREIDIRLSQVDDRINDLVRAYDASRAPVEVHVGLFNTETRELVAPIEPEFVGFIDRLPIETGAEGEEGSIIAKCVAQMREATRRSTATRSDADQRLRNAGDAFFQDVGTIAEFPVFWGVRRG